MKQFAPQSFDRILLDPPCSALGMPNIIHAGEAESCMYRFESTEFIWAFCFIDFPIIPRPLIIRIFSFSRRAAANGVHWVIWFNSVFCKLPETVPSSCCWPAEERRSNDVQVSQAILPINYSPPNCLLKTHCPSHNHTQRKSNFTPTYFIPPPPHKSRFQHMHPAPRRKRGKCGLGPPEPPPETRGNWAELWTYWLGVPRALTGG